MIFRNTNRHYRSTGSVYSECHVKTTKMLVWSTWVLLNDQKKIGTFQAVEGSSHQGKSVHVLSDVGFLGCDCNFCGVGLLAGDASVVLLHSLESHRFVFVLQKKKRTIILRGIWVCHTKLLTENPRWFYFRIGESLQWHHPNQVLGIGIDWRHFIWDSSRLFWEMLTSWCLFRRGKHDPYDMFADWGSGVCKPTSQQH